MLVVQASFPAFCQWAEQGVGITLVGYKSVPMDGLFTESQLSHEEGRVIFENQVLVEVNATKAGARVKEKGGYNGPFSLQYEEEAK